MILRALDDLKNNFSEINRLAQESLKPIYITKNRETIGVYMSLDTYERESLALKLKTEILKAEGERLNGKGIYLEDLKQQLKNRSNML